VSTAMRHPEPQRLPLTNGDWLLVKKYLTAGEVRAQLTFMRRVNPLVPWRGDGPAPVLLPEPDPTNYGLARAAVYLLDWNLTDADKQPLVIAGRDPWELMDVLDNLDAGAWTQVVEAITAHDAAMTAAKDAEKKAPDGELPSSATSPSADILAGAMTT